ncbi:MAG: chorismate--pyruvate lyase family protein [Sulfuricaulis sp.]
MATASIVLSRRSEPLWRPARRLNRSAVPEKYLSWLLDPGSLTERIVNRCRQDFHVQLLSQERRRPLRSEAMVLGMRHGSRAIVRQVQLVCGDTPWIYARTVIPPRTLARKFHRFTRLGARSLGSMLFADPSMERGAVQVASLLPSDELYHIATRHRHEKPAVVWGRRSLFRLGDKPLLVSEFFLPDIVEFSG